MSDNLKEDEKPEYYLKRYNLSKKEAQKTADTLRLQRRWERTWKNGMKAPSRCKK